METFDNVLLLAVLVLLGLAYPLLSFFLKWLAEEDILFTTVREGTAKAIMRGNSFDRFIMSFKGYRLNDPSKRWYVRAEPSWQVLDHGQHRDAEFDDRNPLFKHLGLFWIGWPWANSVYVYGFEWNETRTNPQGKKEVFARSEATDFIFVADFTYAIVTEAAETKDRLPVDLLTLATVAIRNPYRALFSGEDWMERITSAINRYARLYVANQKYEDLLRASGTDDDTSYSAPIIRLSLELPDDKNPDGSLKDPHGLQGRYGIEIRTADLQTVALTGDTKRRSEEAATAQYVAEQEAIATKTAGEAKAHVTRVTSAAEAEALRVRLEAIREYGPAGALLAQLDAMRDASSKAGNTIIWANNPLIASIEQFLQKAERTEGSEKK
ncbi:hypothetical protein HYV30_00430 [Candidatus Kaiserbacteria bacterium]|nr:hypothetical protein [Candidatus Kaiserbacteria bacterium]